MKTAHIRPAIEDAVKAYLQGQTAIDCPVYLPAEVLARGDSSVMPFVVVAATRGVPWVQEVGLEHVAACNRQIDVTISIFSPARDVIDAGTDTVLLEGREQHNTLVSTVMDTFFNSGIIDSINAVADGVRVQALDFVSDSIQVTNDGYETEIELTCYAIGGV